MNSKILLCFLAIFIFISCQTEDPKISEARILMKQLMDEGETPGIAVTVSKDNKVVWSEGFGLANIEQQVPVYPSKTKFRIGSISKALTAGALGVLIKENKIELDVPIQKYVPYFPKKKYEITTRQLAGHLAGIRHYKGLEFRSMKNYHTVKSGLEMFENDPLLFEPGLLYKYTSHGFNLLSAVIEGASGKPFLEYMDEVVINHLKMDNTIADLKDSLIIYRSGFYGMNNGKIVNAPYVDNSYKWAGGGYLSTSEDIVKFGNAILFNELLPEEVKQELITSQKTIDGKETGYGMGFGSGVNEFGRKYYGHGGGSVGGSCNLIIFPEEKLVIAALTNDSRSLMGKSLYKVAEIFMIDETRKN